MATPNIAELMKKAGIGFSEAASLISGGVGANQDLRNWDAIMGSSDPAAAARSGLGQMYSSGENYASGAYDKPKLSQQSGNIGIGSGPNQDMYLMDSQGNALTQIGSKGVLSNGSRAGGTFGMDISGDLQKLGFGDQLNKLGPMGKTLDGDWLDAKGAMSRFNAGNVGGQANGQIGGYGGAGGAGQGSMSAFSSPVLNQYQKNPYLDEMAGNIRTQVTDNLQRNVLPNIRAESIASGGYGDTRNAITDGLAAGEANKGLSSALSNLYGTDYSNQMNRNLQQYGMDQSYALGNKNADNSFFLGNKQADNSYDLGNQNIGLGYANLDRNINNDNKSWQMQGANFGLGIYDRLQAGNQIGIRAGGNIQDTPLNYWQQFSNGANSIGNGYGTSTGSQNAPGNPFMGALGGMQLGQQAANWWGGSPNAAGGSNSSGWGTGSGFGNQDYGSYY